MSSPAGPIVVIALRTDVSHFRMRRPLLVETELRPICRAARARAHPYHPIPVRGNTPPADCVDPLPSLRLPVVPDNLEPVTPTSSPVASPGEPQDESDEESTSASADVIVGVALPDDDGLISKPEGEVGRLKRGYPLQAVLGWNPKRYKQLKTKVNAYVADYINHSASSSNQPTGKIDDLTRLILASYPKIAAKYRNGWPISDLIHLRLKYTSGRIANGHQVPQSKDYPKPLKKNLGELETNVRISE